MTTPYKIIRALIISTALLAVPYALSLLLDGMNWSGSDYVFAWVLLSFVAVVLSLVVGSMKPNSYKIAAGIAVVSLFLLLWVNGAVGIIGDDDINMVYAFVALVLIIGSLIVRMRAAGMTYVLYTAAATQFIIPIIAVMLHRPDFSPGVFQVFILNGFWVVMFAVAGVLFSDAAKQSRI